MYVCMGSVQLYECVSGCVFLGSVRGCLKGCVHAECVCLWIMCVCVCVLESV